MGEMGEAGIKSLKGIEIRQPRAKRSDALGMGSSRPRALKGRYSRFCHPFHVEPLQGSSADCFFPRAALRSALGYRMYKPFRLSEFNG
jgi:hypothetical protein